jgi:hypothetical protein
MKHFLSETVLIITLCSSRISVPANLALKAFEEFIPKGVAYILSDPFTLAFCSLTIIVVSVLSGLYPAFVLSSFAPALALKKPGFCWLSKTRNAYLRKALIVFQFSFAQILIVGTLIMARQIDFMLNRIWASIRMQLSIFLYPGISGIISMRRSVLSSAGAK